MSVQKPKSERNKALQLDDAAADALTALLAVRDDLVTEAQVDKALAEKRRRIAESVPPGEPLPKPPRLAEILVEQGVLDQKQASELAKRLDPEVLPGYRILAEAGKGGMGTVFKARQLSMDRVVALKILSKRLSSDERYVEKFLQEARAAGKLNHENIVSAIDCGAASGLHYFVMEFVDGATVSQIVTNDGPLPWEKAFEYTEQVARALEHAHAHGLVHRDVKPENIIVAETPTGSRCKLCDLGLAKEAVEAGSGEKSKMTEGTPSYCSPEQALGRTDIDAASDVYSLGATLYHLLSGEPPFDGDSARQILWKQVHKPFPDLATTLPDVPERMRAVLAKMVVKDREQRTKSAREFIDELQKARTALSAPVAPAAPAPTAGSAGKLRWVAAAGVVLALGLPAAAFALKAPKGETVAVVATANGNQGNGNTGNNSANGNQGNGGRPTIVRIGPDDPENGNGTKTPSVDPPPVRPSDGGDPDEKAAQLLLDRAIEFRDNSPDDAAGYSQRLKAILERYPATGAAVVAKRSLEAESAKGQAVLDKEIEKAKSDAFALAKDGKWKDACALLDTIAEKWDARVLAPVKPELERARTQIIALAKARLDQLSKDGEAHVAKGEGLEDTLAGLAALEKDAPQPIAKDAHAKADDLKGRLALQVADVVLKDALARRDDAYGKGKLDDAERVIAYAKDDPRVLARKKDLDALVADTEETGRAWRAFDAKVKSFEATPKHAWKRRPPAPELSGEIARYDGVNWTAQVKPFGRRDLLPLDLHDLVPEELIELALPGHEVADLHGAVLFFLARREGELATTTLERMIAAGGADDPALRARIAKLLGADREFRAQALVDRALAANAVNTAPEDVVVAVRSLVDRFSDTNAYLARVDDLKRTYVAARTARLTGAEIAQVVSGRLTKGRDSVKIEYDFSKDAKEAVDWTPDVAISKDASSHWVKGKLLVKGKVRNVAVWEGGALSFDARMISPSADRPNCNLIISDKGGWQGVLVGFGFIFGALTKIRVDPTAPLKPGWSEVLPANICYDLTGGPPVFAGKCLVAERDPVVSVGRAIHYVARRDARGALHGLMGSQNPVNVAVSPRADEAGTVAIAGFETELAVEHVEIVGKLDMTWVGDRARLMADAEASVFPTKKPLPPSGG